MGVVASVVVDVADHGTPTGRSTLPARAEDTAWVAHRGGTVTVPYGKVQHDVVTLEATEVEPGSYDRKVYGPGLGIVSEQSLTGATESRAARQRERAVVRPARR